MQLILQIYWEMLHDLRVFGGRIEKAKRAKGGLIYLLSCQLTYTALVPHPINDVQFLKHFLAEYAQSK